MTVFNREFLDSVLLYEDHDNGDGTGIRYQFDANGNIVDEIALAEVPPSQTYSQSLTALLDEFPNEHAQLLAALISDPVRLTALLQLTEPS